MASTTENFTKNQATSPMEVDKNNPDKVDLNAPTDKFYIIYILFFLLGLVHLLPFTFFTTATAYWMYKFRNTTINETNSEFRTNLQAQFSASLLISLQVSQVVFTTLTIIFGRFMKVRNRMLGILSTVLTLFIVVTVFIKIDTDSWQAGFFAMTMTIVVVISAMNAVFTITMFTILSNFPHHYLAPYMTGGSLSRIFTSTLQILSLALGVSTEGSALIYFCVAIVVLLSTLAAFIVTNQNEFYCYSMRNFQEGQKEQLIKFSEATKLFKKTWSCLTVLGLIILTMNASPTALVVSEREGDSPWNDTYFIPTITYFVAAICDLIGRNMVFLYALKLSGVGWTIISVIRMVVFVPLFMFSNAQPRHHLQVALPHDYQYIILTIVFNFTEGYLYSIGNYNIGKLVSKEELKHAYHVNMFFVGLEMAVFSVASIISVNLL